MDLTRAGNADTAFADMFKLLEATHTDLLNAESPTTSASLATTSARSLCQFSNMQALPVSPLGGQFQHLQVSFSSNHLGPQFLPIPHAGITCISATYRHYLCLRSVQALLVSAFGRHNHNKSNDESSGLRKSNQGSTKRARDTLLFVAASHMEFNTFISEQCHLQIRFIYNPQT
jgi:hypothetical protein